MEPLPLGPEAVRNNHGEQKQVLSPYVESIDVLSVESLMQTNDDYGSASTIAKKDPIQLCSSILDPLVDQPVRKKLSLSASCHSNQLVLLEQQHHALEEEPWEQANKRQKLRHQQFETSDDESMARFRPYQEDQWRIQFKKLIEFKLKNGHCGVPHKYPEDRVLARWVKRQRHQYKKLNDNDPTSTMTARRVEDLEAVGFVWHAHAAAWLEKLNDLKAFKERTGHCKVPSHYPEDAQLSTWVKCQRRQYKLYVSQGSSSMTFKRLHALESLGFVFDTRSKKVAKKNSSKSPT
ncbi:unnamed protein product [Cylindrotheca closterium]|uniref:Helicase-associated domain-containing protein n=1 Tax=Cylindrotheca closterium TaxID=2856 RepID=A0AAD2FHL7_9STRA|nr:unnamed protein product [Cylindrotheca closterium]